MGLKKVQTVLLAVSEKEVGSYGSICAKRVLRLLSEKANQLVLSKDQASVLKEMIEEYSDSYKFSNQQHFANAVIIATWLNTLAI